MQPEDQRRGGEDYTVVARTLVFLTCGEEVLLLQGAPDKRLWAGLYNGLGGHIEPGETPYQSALREVGEEAGLTPQALALRAVIHITMPAPPGVMLFVFVAEVAKTALFASNEGRPRWVHRSQLTTLPLVEDLPVLLPRVLDAGALVYGNYRFTEDGLRVDLDEPF